MPLFNRDAPAPITPEQRINMAVATAEAALSTFTDVVYDLETAAAELDTAALAAHSEADAARAVAASAESAAHDARQSADKVRALLG